MDSKFPKEVKFAFEPLDKNLEKIYLNIKTKLELFCSNGNKLNFSILIIKTIENVESIKNIKNKDKLKIATRCLTEIIKDNSIDNKLINTIPSTIEAIINLSKKSQINKNKKGISIIESISITENTLKNIIKDLKKKNYNLQKILNNSFIILSRIMCILGNYSCLSGNQKKEIAIDIMKYIIVEFKDSSENETLINKTMIKTVFNELPSIIDTFICVNKKVFNINKNDIISCFSCFS